MAYPAFPLSSYWTVHVPTAVGGTVPNWSTIEPLILAAHQRGQIVTYNTSNGQRLTMENFDSTKFYFYGRFGPVSGKFRIYAVEITRSTGAVANTQYNLTM